MKTHIIWEPSVSIPPAHGQTVQPGLAGPLAGIASNCLVIGGGSNFEGALPWNGGKKLYHNQLYVLQRNNKGLYTWLTQRTTLSNNLAYCASVTTKEGIVCIGGENEQGPVKSVFLLSLKNDIITFNALPDLPAPLTSSGATTIGNTIYVAGGLDAKGAVSSFLCLDLARKNPSWVRLPDLPVALSHAVVAAQSNGKEKCIYVIGGRVKTDVLTQFLSSVWEYTPSFGSWKNVGEIRLPGQEAIKLSAGTGVSIGSDLIAVFGGDKGIFYNKTEHFLATIDALKTDAEKQPVIQEKNKMLENHPGFYNEILMFNTITKTFHSGGVIPGKPQVTTIAVSWGDKVFIPGGEIKPGVRTAEVKIGKISQ
jgi:N-acetylneuraminate epimerase